MGQRSAEVLAEQAIGHVNPAELTETESGESPSSSTLLYDRPIIEYITEEETPVCLFTNEYGGFLTQLSDGSEQELDDDLNGKYYLLITDDRILYVAGCPNGDKTIEIEYSEIKAVATPETDNGTVVFSVVLHNEIVYGFKPYRIDNHNLETTAKLVHAYATGQAEFNKDSSGKLKATIIDEAEANTDHDPNNMGKNSAEDLAEEAKGEFGAEILKKTKDDGLVSSSTRLYTKPLIDYLNVGEQPEYVLNNSNQGFRIISPDGSEKTPHHNSDGWKYLLITDQRILYVAGCSGGDKWIGIEYSDIVDVSVEEGMSGGISWYITVSDRHRGDVVYKFYKAIQPYDYEMPPEEYIRKQISTDDLRNGDTADESESFYFISRSRSKELYGEYEIAVDDSGISIGEECRLKFKELAKAQEYSHFAYDRDPDGTAYDGIRLVDSNGDEYYLYKKGSYSGFPEEAAQYIQQKVGDSKNTSLPYVYSLCSSLTFKNPNLKVEGWTGGSSSIEANLDASASSEGKSKGVELGPFTRSKTSSNSSIGGEISGEISDNSYNTEINEIKIYDSYLWIDSGLEVNMDYSDIDNVFKKEGKEYIEHDQGEPDGIVFVGDGIVLQVDSTTFMIENLPDSAPINDAIEFIRSNMTENKEETDADSSNDKAPSEKIRELKSLHEEGILTDEEFESKKEELLDDF